MYFHTRCLVMLVYLATLRQLLGNTVYTRCNRLSELSSCCVEVFYEDSSCLKRVYFVLFSVLYVFVCVLCVLCLYFMLLPSGVIKIIIIQHFTALLQITYIHRKTCSSSFYILLFDKSMSQKPWYKNHNLTSNQPKIAD